MYSFSLFAPLTLNFRLDGNPMHLNPNRPNVEVQLFPSKIWAKKSLTWKSQKRMDTRRKLCLTIPFLNTSKKSKNMTSFLDKSSNHLLKRRLYNFGNVDTFRMGQGGRRHKTKGGLNQSRLLRNDILGSRNQNTILQRL